MIPLHRDPLRLALIISVGVMMIGAFMPWAEGMVGLLPVRFGGFDGAEDSLILAALALGLVVIARDREFITAVEGPRRWAPLLIGIVSVAICLVGRRSAEIMIAHWQDDAGSGSIVLGWWIAVIGAAAVAIVGSITAFRLRPGETRLPRPRMPRRDDVGALSAAGGGVVGALVGATVALNLFPSSTAVAVPLLFFGGLGFVFGVFGGEWVGDRFKRFVG